jgi:SAM-dependent methyltransferase
VLQCTACGLIRLGSQPGTEEFSRYYPESYWFQPNSSVVSRLQQGYRRLVLRDHLAFLKDLPGPILDAGCGGGLMLAMLRERGACAVGLDFSVAAARFASKERVPVVCGTLTKPPFPPGSFRLITMYHMLEHEADPGACIESARTLLAQGGRLVVQVPNANSWQARILRKRWVGFDVPRHLYAFRESDLSHLLRSHGFEIVRRKHFSLRDNPAGLATSLAPGWDPTVRRIRGEPSPSIVKDAAYLTLTIAALPISLVEAIFRKGSTITIDAIKTDEP